MRIISGKYGGRKFDPGNKFSARPTTDQAKESLFNVLNNMIDFEDVKVLDLFSGTGSISYEFASRGCQSIDSVEMDNNHHAFIKSTIKALEADSITAIKADAFKFVDKNSKQYDLIFADPPFDLPNIDIIVEKILTSNILTENGLLVIEHSIRTDLDKYVSFLHSKRVYGKVCFSFFCKKK